jgi:hypothetical protein
MSGRSCGDRLVINFYRYPNFRMVGSHQKYHYIRAYIAD